MKINNQDLNTMPKTLRVFLITIGAFVSSYFLIAFGLILSQRAMDLSNTDSISFAAVDGQSSLSDVPLKSITSDNGSAIRYRHFPASSDTAPLVIVIHGSGWHGGAYLDIATVLSDNGKVEVLVPDLRGHGVDPVRRGDIDYVGQLEDDLAALIRSHGGTKRDVAMVGHSSGGGLIIRFAGGGHGSLLDRAVLIAPFLHHTAPTIRKNAGGWAHPLVRRIIGLSMLNSVGVTGLNDTTIMQFNFPKSVLEGPLGHTATQAYSYRLNTSFAPRDDYLSDVAKLPEFLLIAGSEDDAFLANQFQPTLSSVSSKGTYQLLPKVDHIGILKDQSALGQIGAYLGQPF